MCESVERYLRDLWEYHASGEAVAKRIALHRLAQIMGCCDSLDTTMVYVRGTHADLRRAVEERTRA